LAESVFKSIATESCTPWVSGSLFQPGYFVGMMASMNAKPTQFAFPLCRSFPAISSKSYMSVSNHWTRKWIGMVDYMEWTMEALKKLSQYLALPCSYLRTSQFYHVFACFMQSAWSRRDQRSRVYIQ